MKGVVLAGGSGKRLLPMTNYCAKVMLPIYDRPMIDHAIRTLEWNGIKEIAVVLSPDHSLQVVDHLGFGKYFICVQQEPLGTADALLKARTFVGEERFAVILADNYFEELPDIKGHNGGAIVYTKKVGDPQNYGVVVRTDDGIIDIIEKPKYPVSFNALTGFYLFDHSVWGLLSTVGKSKRGEYELTDVLREYLNAGLLEEREIKGEWIDAGTPERLYQASTLVRGRTL